ncbi:HD domain-containing protein [Flavobacterium psychrophilum]|uniref:Probable phosphohydrolase n=1 Tax=Flavobacterium psychrophilum (strain ATCC 49511 / DSM 21280 / CIP 103535 / JIP02/86) TaxID=402612 RepID=A6GYA0_FLAPJ|nr:HD domain-containing protein [Flavobacterium psychrophilum]QRE55456.1 HD domain-containing protein [Flavobacterium psychrophilum]CAL43073.1 Probable phosphohydrolase [Flavobacterium psychrophilum JIP02/86]
MSNTNKLKIFNDPIYGFITIPNPLIYDLIQHPYFQRLRRISQMGLSSLVYPGANHTRFHHALGCLHIMQKAIQVLRFKNTIISAEEENALYIAILLHDIGHGPFSHAMEHSIVEAVHHEEISLLFMNKLNIEFDGQLNLAIQIFKGEYPRKFMLQLISSQLDMDRMDYLKRDSFYSGVEEGKINSDRLIQMMNVVDDVLVIEEKGIYSVEKFLMARRLMYWQVYLHKTSLVAELTLTNTLKRAKELYQKGIAITCSENLLFFIENKISLTDFNNQILNKFAQLDDTDIVGAIKHWQNHQDFTLSSLSKMIINRDLLKIKMNEENFSKEEIQELIEQFSKANNIAIQEAKYFVFKGKIRNQAYSKSAEPIRILKKDGSIEDVALLSDQLSLKALSKQVTKYFLCFPKQLNKN